MTMPLGNSARISSVSFFKRAGGLCICYLINSQTVPKVGWESMMSSVLYAEKQSFKQVK